MKESKPVQRRRSIEDPKCSTSQAAEKKRCRFVKLLLQYLVASSLKRKFSGSPRLEYDIQ